MQQAHIRKNEKTTIVVSEIFEKRTNNRKFIVKVKNRQEIILEASRRAAQI